MHGYQEIRPQVILKAAVSLDGYLDDLGPERRVFSGAEDLEAVDRLRSSCDAILVGAGTLRSDNPSLCVRDKRYRSQRVRRGKSADPLKVCLTSSGNLDSALKFFQTGGGQKLVYLPEAHFDQLSADLSSCCELVPSPFAIGCGAERENIQFVLADLHRRGLRRLLVEGGSEILAQFFYLGLFDQFRVAVAAQCVAQVAAPQLFSPRLIERLSLSYAELPQPELILRRVEQLGDVVVLNYEVSSS